MCNPILDRNGNPITYKKDKYESTGFNSELAHEVLEVIRAFPDNHDQSSWCSPGDDDYACEAEKQDAFIDDPIETAWSCGTGMCFAGWAVALSVGLDFEYMKFVGEPTVVGGVNFAPDGYGWNEIGEAARQLLGINRYEADDLFLAENTLGDLEQKVADLEHKYARRSR